MTCVPVKQLSTLGHKLCKRPRWTAAMPLGLGRAGWPVCGRGPAPAPPLCAPRSFRFRHACHAGIGLAAQLKLLVDLNHRIADLVDRIALPGNREEHLPAPAPTCPSSPIQPRMTAVVEHRPTTTAALLGQGMRRHRPDRVHPGTDWKP